MKYIALLLLVGCAGNPMLGHSLDDLYVESAMCANANLDCADINAAIEQKETIREWKKNTEMPCPKGLVSFCDTMGAGDCGRRMSKRPVKYFCITRDQVQNLY